VTFLIQAKNLLNILNPEYHTQRLSGPNCRYFQLIFWHHAKKLHQGIHLIKSQSNLFHFKSNHFHIANIAFSACLCSYTHAPLFCVTSFNSSADGHRCKLCEGTRLLTQGSSTTPHQRDTLNEVAV
jgi:hypothetical protein